ncbi:unnamed protein product [Trifolium pratense]|uniref:Uncharacterized protein n=1 Tax=Trifolium pratense TaxID=57577 RepID=A0ACB0L012_TRIPR|nr:unnamed protein product [Trifolium pratense]
MARTKEEARKQTHDQNVSSSTPSSSLNRSPSPPHPPSSPKPSEYVSDTPSPPTNQNLEKLAQVSSDQVIVNPQTPITTIQDPSFLESTQNKPQNPNPVSESRSEDWNIPLTTIVSTLAKNPTSSKPKKTKTFDRSKVRKSARIMSGRKPVVDTIVHVIHNSDSENTLSENPQIENASATQSEPSPTSKLKTKTASKAKITTSSSVKKNIEAEKDKGKGKEIRLKYMIFEKKELRVPMVFDTPENALFI